MRLQKKRRGGGRDGRLFVSLDGRHGRPYTRFALFFLFEVGVPSAIRGAERSFSTRPAAEFVEDLVEAVDFHLVDDAQ